MLLQRLIAYQRDDDETEVPFYARKPVRWRLDINADGSLAHDTLITLAGEEKSERRGRPRTIPSVTKTSGIAPAIGTDNLEYVLGWVTEDPKVKVKPERVAACHDAFIALNKEWAKAEPNGPAAAIDTFFSSGVYEYVRTDEKWSRADLVDIRVDGVSAVDTPEAQRFWASVASGRKGSGTLGLCLACGLPGELLNTIPRQLPQRLVPGATQSASLISVNKATHGFLLSTNLLHSPICQDCGLKVMNNLESLLSDPRHSTYSGDARMAWWIPGGGDFEPDVYLYPDQHLDDVLSLIASARKGWAATVDDTSAEDLERFCAITIGGNVSRVMVRDWIDMPLIEVKHNLGHWFADIAVPGQITYPGVGLLALACGRYGGGLSTDSSGAARAGYARFDTKGADRPDGAYRGLLNAALYGKRLPPGFSRHILHRIRRDGHVDAFRAALCRLCIRRSDPRYRTEEHMDIDESIKSDPSFIAGQIFATYEYLQWASLTPKPAGAKGKNGDSSSGVNTTFTQKFFSGGMTNPTRALNAGASLSQAWMKSAARYNPKRSHWIGRELDRLLGQLAEAGGAPRTANALQQHRFVLGYHQKRDERFNRPATTDADVSPEGTPQS